MADDETASSLPVRRGPGRKPLPSDEQRRHAVTCRLTDAERDQIDAARGKVTRGEYLRLAALAKPPRVVPEINREAWAELARASGNLNQIAAVANKLGKIEGRDSLIAMRDQVEVVRRLLLGIPIPKGEGTQDEG